MTVKDLLREPAKTIHSWRYPHKVSYKFNSRGYRDDEWPTDDLASCSWCVGDSLTMGIGVRVEHSWPRVLQKLTQRRSISVTMAAASNDWIARKVQDLIFALSPSKVYILWTWCARKEKTLLEVYEQRWQQFYTSIRDDSWPVSVSWHDRDQLPQAITQEIDHVHGGFALDVDRLDEDRLTYASEKDCDQESLRRTLNLVSQLELVKGQSQLFHMFMDCGPSNLRRSFLSQASAIIKETAINAQEIWVDCGRDHLHYGMKTHENIARHFAKVSCY